MKKEEFYYGQRVKQWDSDEGFYVYGHVTDIQPHSISIKWNDIDHPCEHFEDEYPTIKDGSPKPNK